VTDGADVAILHRPDISISIKESVVRLTRRGAFHVLAVAALLAVGACVSLDNTSVSQNCSAVTPLTVGVTFHDAITSSSCRLSDQTYANAYRFSVDSQAKLKVTLVSPGGPVITWLTDSSGATVANSYITQSPDTTASASLILKAGTYQLVANSYSTAPTGAVSLTVARDTSKVAGATTVIWVSQSVATAQAVTSGDHTDGPPGTKYYYHLYLRWVRAGAQLQASVHSTAFTPDVLVASLQGGTVALSALDSTKTTATVSYTTGSEDVLLLWVGATDSLQTGAYTLTIN
jgi:hypothetical protein